MMRRRLLIPIISAALALSALPWQLTSGAAATIAPSWMADATIYEVNVRQFSQAGTLNAVTTQLPRLHALGVDVLWFMPLTPISVANRKGSLGSPYSVADYTQLNPSYGTDADFTALVSQAHALGMHVIVDWVANHSGWDNPWVTQHPDWYTHNAAGNIISPAGTDWTDVADLNYDSQELRTAMTSAMAGWVRRYDIDGFRCDAASMVPIDFWNAASATLRAIKPLFMLAEANDSPSLFDNAFSADYGWNMLQFMNDVGSGAGMRYTFTGMMANQKSSYPAGIAPLLFTTNHDENSWNGTEFKRLGAALPGLAVLQFVAPGIPLLYNGQEVGLNRSLAFFEKDPISWPVKTSSWTSFYAKLIAFHKANVALRVDEAAAPADTLKNDNVRVISFARQRGNDRVVYVMNISKDKQKVTVAMGKAATMRNARTGKLERVAASQALQLQPFEYRVWVSQGAPAQLIP